MKSHSILRLVTSLFLLFVSMQSYAAQWYHVEVIVFEQLNAVTDEQWPVMPDTMPKASLTPGMSSSIIHPASNSKLNNTAASLNRSSQYRVHYHKAWKQPILRKGRAKAVKILSSDGLIEGSIRLDKATYLHASVDLWLKENYASNRNPHLEQSRRIRSKERYFFDHPKMGVLLKLTPLAAPAAVQANAKPIEITSLPEEATPTVSE